MLNKILDFLSRDTSELSTTGLVFICIGVLLFVLLNIFLIKAGRAIVATSGKTSFSFLKITMIALAPTVFNIAAVFNYELPLNIIIVITAIMCIIVIMWNFLSYGLFRGLLLSYLHIVGGIVSGLMIAAFVFLALFMIVMMFVKPFELPSAGNNGAPPEYVRDLNTGETYYVDTNASGELIINKNGSIRILRPESCMDTEKRYVDGFGGNYIGFDI